MANATLEEVLAQANSLSAEERRLLADKILRDLKVEDRPRRSAIEFLGALPWDGQDIDEKIRRMRDEG